jgi:hypothetical protein
VHIRPLLSDQFVRHRVWFQPPHRTGGPGDLEEVVAVAVTSGIASPEPGLLIAEETMTFPFRHDFFLRFGAAVVGSTRGVRLVSTARQSQKPRWLPPIAWVLFGRRASAFGDEIILASRRV